MKMLHRVFLNLIRHKKETIVRLVLMIIIFSVLVGAFLVKNASEQTVLAIKDDLGATITIEGDYSYVLGNDVDYPNYQVFLDDTERIVNIVNEYSDDDRIRDIGINYHIQSNIYNYYPSQIGGSVAVEYINDEGEVEIITLEDICNNAEIMDDLLATGEIGQNQLSLLNLFATNDIRMLTTNTANVYKIEYGDLELASGRQFEEEEIANGEAVAIVAKGYIYEDGQEARIVVPGDTLEFVVWYIDDNYNYCTETFELEVVGTFTDTAREATGEISAMEVDEELTIYVPEKYLFNLMEHIQTTASEYGLYILSEEWANEYYSDKQYDNYIYRAYDNSLQLRIEPIKIKLYSVDDLDDVVNELKEKIGTSNVTYITSSVEYDEVSGPIGTLDTVSNILFISIFILMVIVLILLILISVINRKQEIGILISMGEGKIKIWLQVFIENVILGGLSIVIALLVGNYFANTISTSVINQYLQANSTELEEITNRIINSFMISMTSNDILTMVGIVFSIILVATLLTMIYISTIEPKKILMK